MGGTDEATSAARGSVVRGTAAVLLGRRGAGRSAVR